MGNRDEVMRRVHQALEHEPRIDIHRHPIKVGYTDSAVILEGEVGHPAAKKLALERAAAVAGVRGIVDRLRVAPGERKGDGAIRDSLLRRLLEEGEFRTSTLRMRVKGKVETLREVATDWGGDIEVGVEEGVVSLEGRVLSQSHRRAAGMLAWWTPGCRDVVNALDVQPPEDDNDNEVVDALLLVLEMDPLVQTDRIRANCRNYVLTLQGHVRSEEERRRVEFDAWCLFGVDGVVNRLQIST